MHGLFSRPSLAALNAWAAVMVLGLGVLIGGAAMPEDATRAGWSTPLVVLGASLAVIATAWFLLAHTMVPGWLRRVRLRPYLAGKPHPKQWLLDYEAEDQGSFGGKLVTIRKYLDIAPQDQNQGDRFVIAEYHIHNGSLRTTRFSSVGGGPVRFRRAQLQDLPVIVGGSGGWEPGATAHLRLRQRVSESQLHELTQEIDERGLTGLLNMREVRLGVSADAIDGAVASVTIALSDDLPWFGMRGGQRVVF